MTSPDKLPEEDFRLRVICAQYHECAGDHRHYSALIWQIPAVAIVIGGTLLALSFRPDIDPVIKVVTAFFGAALMFVMTVALERYRMFELRRREDLKRFEEVLATYGGVEILRDGDPIVREIRAKEVPITWCWAYQWSAFQWLRLLMYIVTIILTIIVFYAMVLCCIALRFA